MSKQATNRSANRRLLRRADQEAERKRKRRAIRRGKQAAALASKRAAQAKNKVAKNSAWRRVLAAAKGHILRHARRELLKKWFAGVGNVAQGYYVPKETLTAAERVRRRRRAERKQPGKLPLWTIKR